MIRGFLLQKKQSSSMIYENTKGCVANGSPALWWKLKGDAQDMNENLAYEEEVRDELIGGRLVAMAPAFTNHNRIKRNISTLFDVYLRGHVCEVLPDGEAVYLTKTDYFCPDVMVVCDPEKIKPDGVHGAPDLVVEVLSPATAQYDRGRKKDVYEACGVKEYWIVSPGDKTLEQYILRDGKLAAENTYAQFPEWMLQRMKQEEREAVATEFQCSLYGDLHIRLSDVFARVP